MTVGGLYTISELKALLKAKDQDIAAVLAAWNGFKATWKARDPAAEDAWASDWNAFAVRWSVAKGVAESEIGMAQIAPIPDDANIQGDIGYRMVLLALSPQGVEATGSFQNLWDRLVAAMGKPIPEGPEPQPVPGSDLDLGAMNKGEKVLDKTLIAGGIVAGAVLLSSLFRR